tara:strand:- start:1240 stop:3156 length:1917 start_codon:yes stop_codon:yes gene_type:complete
MVQLLGVRLDNLAGEVLQDKVTGLPADLAAKVATTDLASTDAGKGASLVGLEEGGAVTDAVKYITPEMKGADIGDSGTAANFATAAGAARDGGKVLRLRPGSYYAVPGAITVADGESLTIEVEGDGQAHILPTASSTSAIITLSDAATLSVRGIRFGDTTNTPLIAASSSASSAKRWSIKAENCLFDISNNTNRKALQLIGYRGDLTFTGCTFIGHPASATSGVSAAFGQVLLDAGGAENVDQDAVFRVDGCQFFGGSCGINQSGTNDPGKTFILNSVFKGQKITGIRGYHAVQAMYDNLIIEDCEGENDTSEALQGAALFLDVTSPYVLGNRITVSNIIIRDCAGIGVQCEELQGVTLSAVHVINQSAVSGHSGISTAFLIGGQCYETTFIGCQAQGTTGGPAVLIDGTSTSVTGTPRNIVFQSCTFRDNDLGGIYCTQGCSGLSVLGGTLCNNSGDASGVTHDISISGTAPSRVTVAGVHFKDGGSTSDSAANIKTSVSGGEYIVANCQLDGQASTLVDLQSPGKSSITGGSITSGKNLTANSNLRIRDVANYKTDYVGSITTTAASEYTLAKATMGMGTGAQGANYVLATYLGTANYKASAYISSGDVKVRLTDSAGALVAGDVQVLAYMAGALR